jgi:adenosine deaminase
MDLKSFIHALPKAELHLHLEGAVAADTVIDLAGKHGVPLPDFSDESDIYDFADLAEFLKVCDIVCRSIRTADDFHRVTYEALVRCAGSNARYVEFFFSPGAHLESGISYPQMLDGIIAGMEDAERELKVTSRLIPAINRELGPAVAGEFLDMVLADRRDEVIGIGLDYLETPFPPGPYAGVYARAKAAGLKATAHAGESGPASNIRESIALLGCERIDHGYHIVDDPELVVACLESRIGFTCCPSTTHYTTIWRDPEAPDHPIRTMIAAGLNVVLNTDDPGLFRTDLDNDYLIAAEKMDVNRAAVAEVALNGIRASWLDEGSKSAMLADWKAEIASLPGGSHRPEGREQHG